MKKFRVTFEFPSFETRQGFVDWLFEQGEQDYWSWCDFGEDNEDYHKTPYVFFEYWKNKKFIADLQDQNIIISTK
jgi:hypothetical protein